MGLGLGGKRDAHSSLQNLNHARPCDVDDNVGPATPAQKLAVVPPGMESTRRPIAPAAPNEHAHRIAKRAGPSANRAATRGALACDGQIFHPGHRAKLMYVNLHPPRSDPHHHPTPPWSLPPDKHAFATRQTCLCRPTNMHLPPDKHLLCRPTNMPMPPTNMHLPPDKYAFATRQTRLCRPTTMPLPPDKQAFAATCTQ